MAEFETSLDPQQRAWSALNKLEQNATPHDLLEAGSKVPQEMRNPYYQQAAWKAMRQGDVDLARQIVADYISNPMERKQMLANFDREMLMRSSQQGKLEEARQLLAHLRSDEERATTLTQLATITAAKGDKKTALQLMDEAHSLVNRRPENHAQLSAQLQIANSYASLDPDRGFQILEPITDLLNELASAAAVLQGFDHSGSFKDGELVQVGGGMVPSMIQQCTGTLGVLASANLDRAKAVADRFQRNEARLSARLAAVQAVLSPQRAPGRFQRLPVDYMGRVVTR